jgi:UDP-2,4-diacetamido-2,4,6-trideoxy-beta-L-altropyranose hydrolase
MNIVIRADSSYSIGTGHVVRCLNLATQLKKLGYNAVFICEDLPGNVINLIEEKQFKVITLPEGKGHDSLFVLEANKDLKARWIILDSYRFGVDYENSLKANGSDLFVIDDLLTPHPATIILNQNFYPDRFDEYRKTNSSARTFLGPEYAILGTEYQLQKMSPRKLTDVNSVLVFFGGVDMIGETVKFLHAVSEHKLSQLFHVAVGKNNPYLPKIEKLAASLPNVTLHIQTQRMRQLMEQSDIFIGAGGTVTWERCCLGLPAVCVSVADNQKEIAENLGKAGIHLYLGEATKLTAKDYANALSLLISDAALRAQFYERSLQLKVGSRLSEVFEALKQE